MRYFALATDYDDTLAESGKVAPAVINAIDRLRKSGRRILLVTGRRLNDLLHVLPEIDRFDYVVAENGAVVYQPSSRTHEKLAKPLPDELYSELQRRGVAPLEKGEVIIATHASERVKVLDAIHKLGLEAQILFNGHSLMVLPHGINKAVGTARVLRKMRLSFHEVVGVGDSENDHSLLESCECGVAVGNACEAIKGIADSVTRGQAGKGVIELIDQILEDDLADLAPKLKHSHIEFGKRRNGETAWLPAYGQNVLVTGPPASGKTTFTVGLVERLIEREYQVCIVDPEGDYGTLPDVIALGSPDRAPSISEVLSALEDPKVNVSINLLGVSIADRPEYLSRLFPSLQTMRSRTGRPQWIVIDEVHHVFPSPWEATPLTLPQKFGETIFLTAYLGQVARVILQNIDTLVVSGKDPHNALAEFCRIAERPYTPPPDMPVGKNEVVTWFVKSSMKPFIMQVIFGKSERLRHLRKYAEGDLGGNSFYFRGPDKRLNLKAQNLQVFTQISEGLDIDTWNYHFKRGDYSRWFKNEIKDGHLASETKRIEKRSDFSAEESRRQIRELIRARYAV